MARRHTGEGAVSQGGRRYRVNLEKRWVSVAFTWNELRALGVDEASLATFPEEFRQGMAARWQVLGDTGANHPGNWAGGLGGPQLHAIAILFARDAAERERERSRAQGIIGTLRPAWRCCRRWTWRRYRSDM